MVVLPFANGAPLPGWLPRNPDSPDSFPTVRDSWAKPKGV